MGAVLRLGAVRLLSSFLQHAATSTISTINEVALKLIVVGQTLASMQRCSRILEGWLGGRNLLRGSWLSVCINWFVGLVLNTLSIVTSH